MTSSEIRTKFLNFFAARNHTVVASDSLVPKDDPTVLFTTAGMQQFKRQFLGYAGDYTRAASSQKCLRTDDLDKVGKTDFHHTFFEMLGNFSFGDYFKKEAVTWAWEFLTQELKIPADKLWVSVYTEDEEAAQIWLKEIKIDPRKLVRLGDKSNFWPAEAKEKGPNGPCGPCSEIFYDYGINPKCTRKKCDPACDCGRFSEVWNLVFTQFDRKEGGVLEPLPNKNIDTGMGLERLVAVVQGKKSNYETDLFAPILKSIDAHVGKGLTAIQRHVIADHLRAIVFAITDGVIPSNEGRGYVVKRLIIDITDIALQSGQKETVIYKLVPAVVEAMANAYPELKNNADNCADIIKNIELLYIKLRQEQIPALKTEIKRVFEVQIPKQQYISALGKIMFDYRDTFGLTLGTIESTFYSVGISSEDTSKAKDGFRVLMSQQQKKSREGSKMTGDVFTGADLDVDIPKTKFEGYELIQSTATILRLYIDNQKVREVSKGDQIKIVLDKTPFYAEAGGQIGDTGYLVGKKGKIRVEDTQKINDVYVHRGVVAEGLLRVEESVKAEIDAQRRLSIMRHHTATHLLQAALREVLGRHVQQQGSLVAEDRLRFDFTHPKGLTREELDKIEQRVNELILRCDAVTKDYLPIAKAKESGALAFFAEKYGDIVRVVTIDGYSKEFCGGTHLDSTGQIGLFKIVNECAIAQGIRRLEAKTGTAALEYIKAEEKQLAEAAGILKSSGTDLVDRLNKQLQRVKQLEKDLEKYRFEAVRNTLDTVIESAQTLNGTKIVDYFVAGLDMNLLRKIADLIRQKSKSSVIVLGTRTEEDASLLLAVTEDVVKKGLKANELIKEIAPLIDGSGGGAPQMAQAGSKRVEKVEEAVRRAGQLIKEKLKP